MIHYERRLHQLLLKEEQSYWVKSNLAAIYEPLVGASNTSSSSSSNSSSISVSARNSLDDKGLAAVGGFSFQRQSANGKENSTRTGNGNGHMAGDARAMSCSAVVQAGVGSGAAAAGPVTSISSGVLGYSGQASAATAGSGAAAGAGAGFPPVPLISHKASKPEVTIQNYKQNKYWLVSIKCKVGQLDMMLILYCALPS